MEFEKYDHSVQEKKILSNIIFLRFKKLNIKRPEAIRLKQDGNVAEWLRRGLQILVSRFDSGRCLQKKSCFSYKKK